MRIHPSRERDTRDSGGLQPSDQEQQHLLESSLPRPPARIGAARQIYRDKDSARRISVTASVRYPNGSVPLAPLASAMASS